MSSRLLLGALILLPAFTSAADMRSVHVEYEDGIYYMESEVWFDAGQAAVYEVFSKTRPVSE